MQRTVLFLVPYPLGESPSQRFRFEQYFDAMKEHSMHVQVQSFLTLHNWKVFSRRGAYVSKALALISGLLRRCFILLSIPKAQFIFVHREALPLGPPIMEWIIAKVFRKKIIYDFDDAIWLTDKPDEPAWLRWLKGRGKVSRICGYSHKVSCGNQYLCNFAKQFNSNVFLVPTIVDTERQHNPLLFPEIISDGMTIGWTGSASTLKYLELLQPVLSKLEAMYPSLRLIVIADAQPSLKFKNLEFVQWSRTTEVESLMKFDVGIMPLPDDKWANGKCGFKAIQYMAMQVAPVISPVGMNRELVNHGATGFLAQHENEWIRYTSALLEDQSLRRAIGSAARKKIIENYSVSANRSSFLTLFA